MVASMPAQFATGTPGTVGYVMPGVAVEVLDDHEQVLPSGKEGNLRIRSDYSVKEYLDDPSETQRSFRNGWFYPESRYLGSRGQLTGDNMLVISSLPDATSRE
jgi:acyl-CoA synthetase (AMP-forming)/AMP-acid ligase II